ncbi:MAG: hypothetical protein ACR2KV_16930 [Solirubrobacteraceae bacterium]
MVSEVAWGSGSPASPLQPSGETMWRYMAYEWAMGSTLLAL